MVISGYDVYFKNGKYQVNVSGLQVLNEESITWLSGCLFRNKLFKGEKIKTHMSSFIIPLIRTPN